MAVSKTQEFTTEDQELADPARLAILRLLAARQACVCGELVLELPLSQSTVSQHLKELKAAGLVQGDIDGPRVCYCLAPAGWARARQLLGGLLEDIAPVQDLASAPAAKFPTPTCAC